MLDAIIIIFSIFSLSFLIKETDGPWGSVAYIRNFLIKDDFIGVFCYKLLSCYYCLGCHVGYIIYMLYTTYNNWTFCNFILWSLAGGAISFIMNLIVEKLGEKNE